MKSFFNFLMPLFAHFFFKPFPKYTLEISFIIITIMSLGIGCTENMDDSCPDAQSNNESITYDYYNDSVPIISALLDQSKNLLAGPVSVSIDGSNVNITIPGIRARTDENIYEITNFFVEEKGGESDCFINNSEFGSINTSFVPDIASVLVLDMSTSLDTLIGELKTYAKEYAKTIVEWTDNSKVAIVFFSSRDAIMETGFYNSTNIQDLNNQIDDFVDYQNRTALYQATKTGLNLLENEDFDGEKSLVIFTDGDDNDSNSPSQLLAEIQASETIRFAIGLKGNDFNQTNLLGLLGDSPGNLVIAESDSELQDVFRIAGRGVTSVYQLQYSRSNQTLSAAESIEIRISMETAIIE